MLSFMHLNLHNLFFFCCISVSVNKRVYKYKEQKRREYKLGLTCQSDNNMFFVQFSVCAGCDDVADLHWSFEEDLTSKI